MKLKIKRNCIDFCNDFFELTSFKMSISDNEILLNIKPSGKVNIEVGQTAQIFDSIGENYSFLIDFEIYAVEKLVCGNHIIRAKLCFDM